MQRARDCLGQPVVYKKVCYMISSEWVDMASMLFDSVLQSIFRQFLILFLFALKILHGSTGPWFGTDGSPAPCGPAEPSVPNKPTKKNS